MLLFDLNVVVYKPSGRPQVKFGNRQSIIHMVDNDNFSFAETGILPHDNFYSELNFCIKYFFGILAGSI